MARYIDIDSISDDYMQGFTANAGTYLVVRKILRSVPTADVEEVKHGKWKKHRDDYDCEYIECSVCGEEFYPPDNEFEFWKYPKFCQECGAKMDGVNGK